MINVILIKQFKNTIDLINCINSINQSLIIFKIISNVKEFFNITSTNTIDILIFDNEILKDLDTIEFAKIISLVKNIIILNNDLTISNIDFTNKCLFSNESQLPLLLNKYLLTQKQSISNEYETKTIIMKKISDELKYLGYNLSYYGTKYLIECIYYFYEHQNLFDESTLNSIYKILAQKYNKSENNIKCNITRATSIMLCECEENKLKNYLGLCYLPKTGSRTIIQTVLNKINYS